MRQKIIDKVKMMIVNKVIVVICAFAMLSQPLFFSFMGLLGIEYEGTDSSVVYVAYIITIAVLSLLIYIYGVAAKGILKRESILIGIVILLLILHILWVMFDPFGTDLFPRFLAFFVLFGLPGFFAAATVIKMHLTPQLMRIGEMFFITMAFGVVIFSVLPSFAGVRTASLAGASYQALSYYSAFTFGMLLIYSMYLPKAFRFSWVKSFWYKSLSYGLMLGCALGCFMGGGRGAFLLLIAYLFMVFTTVFLNKENFITQKGIVNTFVKLFLVVLLFTVFFSYFWGHEFIQSGFFRAIQFISADGGIDLERGSSGRKTVYQDAIEYIAEKPLAGYGPFGFREKTLHAHNIFLEILLQVGAVGLIAFMLFFGMLVINARKNWSLYNYWAFGLFLYPLIMTMFSGAYLHSALFCFGVTFMTVYKKKGMESFNGP